MIKLLSIILISSVLIFAQDDDKQNPNVELPDFVITGTEKINVEKVKKIEPELVTTISEEFIKPAHSPEELELRQFPNPIKKNINFEDSIHYQSGYLDLAAGIYNLPSGKFYYSIPNSAGIFSTSINALNQRAHVEESDKYEIGADVEQKFFSGAEAGFLPGSEYRLRGEFYTNHRKFYGSLFTPELRRNLNRFSGLFSFSNFQSKYFQSAVEINNSFTSVPDEEYKDNNFTTKAFGKLILESFTLSGNAVYKYNSLSNTLFTGINTNYFSIFPRIGLDISELFKVEFGLSFSQGASQNYFNPYASLGLKLDQNFTLYGEFYPHAELTGVSSFLLQNPYLDLSLSRDLYVKYSTDITAAFRYERQKYFQINGGISIKGSSNYPYFNSVTDSTNDNYKFAVLTTDTRMFTGFLDLYYHAGPFGYLYGRGEFNIAKDSSSNYIPYIPQLTANAVYGYNFNDINLNAEVRFTFASDTYIDVSNEHKIPSYVDLGFKFVYQYEPKFAITLELANIFQHENYRWARYKELPANVSAGLHLIF